MRAATNDRSEGLALDSFGFAEHHPELLKRFDKAQVLIGHT